MNPDIYPDFANSVDPDQVASSEANWSESALFVIKYMNLYQQPGSSNLTGWKLGVLRFYGPVNPMGSYQVQSVYLITRLLGRLSPLSG